MKDTTWNPAAFLRACRAEHATPELISVELTKLGHRYGSSAVRKWQREGSPGPRTEAVAHAVQAILRKRAAKRRVKP